MNYILSGNLISAHCQRFLYVYRMLQVEYPEHDFKIKLVDKKECIFDEVRKRWLRLTNEEWVRQNFIQYLLQVKKYPLQLIAVEKQIKLGELNKRFDIVIYKNSQPWMMVECKEMNVPLNSIVLQQIIEYNMALPVNIFVITNGKSTYAFECIDNGVKELSSLPDY